MLLPPELLYDIDKKLSSLTTWCSINYRCWPQATRQLFLFSLPSRFFFFYRKIAFPGFDPKYHTCSLRMETFFFFFYLITNFYKQQYHLFPIFTVWFFSWRENGLNHPQDKFYVRAVLYSIWILQPQQNRKERRSMRKKEKKFLEDFLGAQPYRSGGPANTQEIGRSSR